MRSLKKKNNKNIISFSAPKKSIFLDNASTTPVDPQVLEVMIPYFTTFYGNASSLHAPGQDASKAVHYSRKLIANIINGHENEIVFTSGGTESNNLAIQGVVEAYYQNNKEVPQIITTTIEHPSVLATLIKLEKQSKIKLVQIKPNKNGIVPVEDVVNAVNKKTILVSIMYANNEIGTIQPINDIGRKIIKYRQTKNTIYPYFHTDACQAGGYLDLNVEKLHVDLMTLNSGKIYGPKGVGMLFVRRSTKIKSMIQGGSQELRLRAGTENVPGIVGFAKALEIVQKKKEKENIRLEKLRNYLIDELLKIPKSRLNGHPEKRLSNNINISFLDVEGESIMLYLDAQGIYCSTGSACASTSLHPSHVILALGLSYEGAHGSMRFTLGSQTKKSDLQYVVKKLPPIIARLRELSPINLDMSHFN